jgi:hypothetical protein
MTPQSLQSLRRPLLRQSLALLATVALLIAGFAQAAHFHKSDSTRGTDTHLQCLLCLHADRSAGPPVLPQAAAQSLLTIALVVVSAARFTASRIPRRYDARGPPHI